MREVLAAVAPASVGVASYPAEGTDLDALLRVADAQLYEYKAHQRESASSEERLSWAATLAHAVDLRMDPRHEHSPNVATLAVEIARRMGWSDEELGSLRIAAMLHDVGKAAIPDSILRKPGKLSAEEFAEIKQHPLLGAGIVERVDGLEDIVPWIRHAHEHWDGSGYPDGLAGEDIPLASRDPARRRRLRRHDRAAGRTAIRSPPTRRSRSSSATAGRSSTPTASTPSSRTCAPASPTASRTRTPPGRARLFH